ncbi:MAG TPA: hypothetical protein VN249_10320 [Prolixibacteraceae bacterium]|nr:hypothetical protein [Prolixibacteraceae bacterium]
MLINFHTGFRIDKPKKFICNGLMIVLLLVFYSCTKTEDPTEPETASSTSPSLTTDKEISEASAYYKLKGAEFKFRAYHWLDDFNNRHETVIRKLMEDNGKISFLGDFWAPHLGTATTMFMLNVQTDRVNGSKQATAGHDLGVIHDNEITSDNEMVSYNYTNKDHYGGDNGAFHNHSKDLHTGPFSLKSVRGYMARLNGKFYMLSMGLNSNAGKPTLYSYVPATLDWTGQVQDQILAKGIFATNDVSKAGNSDRLFWAWLSYSSSYTDGQLNVTWYDGSQWGAISTLKVGSIGTGSGMFEKFRVKIHRNPNSKLSPYVTITKANSIDFYRLNGTSLEAVVLNVPVPSTINNSGMTPMRDLVFTGNNIYLCTGYDKNLYKLSGNSFINAAQELIGANKVSAIESGATGLYLSIETVVQLGTNIRVVSDVIFIKN